MYGQVDAPAPTGPQNARAWFEKERQHPCSWAIEHEGQLIGATRLNITHDERRARFAIGMYSTEFTGRGLGTEAAILVLGYACDELQLHRVDLRVIEYNHRAIRIYKKVGFTVEGGERQTVFVNGEWHDDLMMAMLDREYRGRYGADS